MQYSGWQVEKYIRIIQRWVRNVMTSPEFMKFVNTVRHELRTDTRLVFCHRKLMRTDILFTRTTKLIKIYNAISLIFIQEIYKTCAIIKLSLYCSIYKHSPKGNYTWSTETKNGTNWCTDIKMELSLTGTFYNLFMMTRVVDFSSIIFQ